MASKSGTVPENPERMVTLVHDVVDTNGHFGPNTRVLSSHLPYNTNLLTLTYKWRVFRTQVGRQAIRRRLSGWRLGRMRRNVQHGRRVRRIRYALGALPPESGSLSGSATSEGEAELAAHLRAERLMWRAQWSLSGTSLLNLL